MKSIDKPLRTAYYSALNGNLTIDAANVPVADGFSKAANFSSHHVIIDSITNGNGDTLETFLTNAVVQLQIVTQQYNSFTSDMADDLENQILEIIIPTIRTNGLPAQAGYQITNVRKLSSIPRNEPGVNPVIASKILRISQQILQT